MANTKTKPEGKNMTNKKDAGKDQDKKDLALGEGFAKQDKVEFKTLNENRVVLNLKTSEARMLSAAMQNIAESYKEDCYEKELAAKISKRIEHTIMKQSFIAKCAEQGIKPSKESMKEFMGSLK